MIDCVVSKQLFSYGNYLVMINFILLIIKGYYFFESKHFLYTPVIWMGLIEAENYPLESKKGLVFRI